MKITKVLIHCTCGRCGSEFYIMSTTGPSELCDACAKPLLDILFGR